jgi:hypothetical protein
VYLDSLSACLKVCANEFCLTRVGEPNWLAKFLVPYAARQGEQSLETKNALRAMSIIEPIAWL